MTDYVTIPAPNILGEYRADTIDVTASEVADVLTSSHLHCTWEVSRRGVLEPCGGVAVAIRYDEYNGGVTEVCKGHAHRVLVPLAFIAEVARRT